MVRVVILFTFLLFARGHAVNDFFEFKDNKLQGALNPAFLEKLVFTFHPDTFFETGTFDGKTTVNASQFFKHVITVEIYEPLFKRIQPKFRSYRNIASYFGNSSQLIASIGKELQGTTLFWLDAHYSGKGTGVSDSVNSGSAEAITAIREELAAIHTVGIQDCVILIDDIRGFGTEISDQIFLGCWAYPTLQEVKLALLKINPQFEIALLGDMLLAYDSSKYQPQFSATVEACTKTRLYDGQNLTYQELFDLETKIQMAPPHEAAFIASLYKMMTGYKDPMFWHDLWYGLTQLGRRNYKEANIAFQKIPGRIQSGKFKEGILNPVHYEHESLKCYLEKMQ
ncbi:MAG: hypothetical protein KBC64_07625 [Simkaniaceae bacterium]|nr:hypothetical protein [Simkaniaceae bacterium]